VDHQRRVADEFQEFLDHMGESGLSARNSLEKAMHIEASAACRARD